MPNVGKTALAISITITPWIAEHNRIFEFSEDKFIRKGKNYSETMLSENLDWRKTDLGNKGNTILTLGREEDWSELDKTNVL